MKELTLSQLSSELRKAIADVKHPHELSHVGTVLRIGDGVAWIAGLRACGYNEMVSIDCDDGGGPVMASALNLEEDQIGTILFGNERRVKAGAKVHLTGKILEVPVGPELVGRVVNPLGEPLDGLGDVTCTQFGFVEKIAPGVITREPVNKPLMTGIKAIDSMTPIGRGQRELIIGDRQTGKTAIVIDTIINQHRQENDVVCIYIAIGQKMSTIARIVDRLRRENAMEKTIVVATSASDPAALQYIAPYAGTAMGEYFRDNGQDALVIHDDLSKHAWVYRQISLLLRRPPGREAYPGDVFYLHSRLLERAAKLSPEHGGGSLTALPIIETQANDVSAYIPTNVISITDGQIYLEPDLFYQGIRPAMNVGLSVSRVGGAAQTKAMKAVAPSLRLELAQYRELAAFAQFSSDLDPETKQRIERGKRVTEVLKQGQYEPMSLPDQVAVLLAVTSGAFDALPVDEIKAAELKMLHAIHQDVPGVLDRIRQTGLLSDDDKNAIMDVVKTTITLNGPNGENS